jgi:hypothetical protein
LATSVYVSGGDVFVVGSVGMGGTSNERATLWVNGVPQTLSRSRSASRANSVHVSGSDVFVTGWVGNLPNRRAVLWVNGVSQTLCGTR